MADIGNSNSIARAYLDSLLIETRYMDSTNPTLDFELYGRKAATPIMTAALSHLDHFMFPGAAEALAKGAAEAGAILWYGMAEEEEIERLAAYGAPMIEIIKPYADRASLSAKFVTRSSWGSWPWASISIIPSRRTALPMWSTVSP